MRGEEWVCEGERKGSGGEAGKEERERKSEMCVCADDVSCVVCEMVVYVCVCACLFLCLSIHVCICVCVHLYRSITSRKCSSSRRRRAASERSMSVKRDKSRS